MKSKTLIFILLLLFCFKGFGQTNGPIEVLPNLGIDNVRLMESKPTDVINFRGEKLKKRVYLSIRCGNSGGKRRKSTTIYSDQQGIEFKFYQRELSKWLPLWTSKKLIAVSINKPTNTSDGLKVGVSDKNDVLKIYGPMPEGWTHKRYIYFNNLGIAFDFDEQEVVTEIKIYKI